MPEGNEEGYQELGPGLKGKLVPLEPETPETEPLETDEPVLTPNAPEETPQEVRQEKETRRVVDQGLVEQEKVEESKNPYVNVQQKLRRFKEIQDKAKRERDQKAKEKKPEKKGVLKKIKEFFTKDVPEDLKKTELDRLLAGPFLSLADVAVGTWNMGVDLSTTLRKAIAVGDRQKVMDELEKQAKKYTIDLPSSRFPTNSATELLVQEAFPYIVSFGALASLKWFRQLSAVKRIGTVGATEGLISAVHQDPGNGTITDALWNFKPAQPYLVDFLRTEPGDDRSYIRFKTFVENSAIGTAFEGLIESFLFLAKMQRNRTAAKKAHDKIAKETKKVKPEDVAGPKKNTVGEDVGVEDLGASSKDKDTWVYDYFQKAIQSGDSDKDGFFEHLKKQYPKVHDYVQEDLKKANRNIPKWAREEKVRGGAKDPTKDRGFILDADEAYEKYINPPTKYKEPVVPKDVRSARVEVLENLEKDIDKEIGVFKEKRKQTEQRGSGVLVGDARETELKRKSKRQRRIDEFKVDDPPVTPYDKEFFEGEKKGVYRGIYTVSALDLEYSKWWDLPRDKRIEIMNAFDEDPIALIYAMDPFKRGQSVDNKKIKLFEELSYTEFNITENANKFHAGHVPDALEVFQGRLAMLHELMELDDLFKKRRDLRKHEGFEEAKNINSKKIFEKIYKLAFTKAIADKGESLVGQSLRYARAFEEADEIFNKFDLESVLKIDPNSAEGIAFVNTLDNFLKNLSEDTPESAKQYFMNKFLKSPLKSSQTNPEVAIDILGSLMTHSLLSSYKTFFHISGITTGRSILEGVNDTVSDTGLFVKDYVQSLGQGKRRTVPATQDVYAKSLLTAWPEAFKNAWSELQGLRPDIFKRQSRRYDLRKGLFTRFTDENTKLYKVLSIFEPLNIIASVDSFHKTFLYRAKLERLARFEAAKIFNIGSDEYIEAVDAFIQNPTASMLDEIDLTLSTVVASRRGDIAPTIAGGQDKNFGSAFTKIREGAEDMPVLGAGAKYVFVFLNPQVNVVDDTIQHLPILNYLNPDVRKRWLSGDQRLQGEILTKQVLGASIIATATYLASSGKLKGSNPSMRGFRQDLANEYRPLENALITPSGNEIRFERSTPLFALLALGADLQQAHDYASRGKSYDIPQFLGDSLGSIISNTFDGRNLADRIDNLYRYLSIMVDAESRKDFRGDIKFNQFIPFGNLMYQLTKDKDGVFRLSTTSPLEVDFSETQLRLENIKKNFFSSIPGLSEKLPRKLDVFGNPVIPHPGINIDFSSPWNTLFFPYSVIRNKPSKLLKDPVRKELEKVIGVRSYYIYNKKTKPQDIDWGQVMPYPYVGLHTFTAEQAPLTAPSGKSLTTRDDRYRRQLVSQEMSYRSRLSSLPTVRLPDKLYNNLILLSNGNLRDWYINPKTGLMVTSKQWDKFKDSTQMKYVNVLSYTGRLGLSNHFKTMNKRDYLKELFKTQFYKEADNEKKKFYIFERFTLYNAQARQVFHILYKEQIRRIIDKKIKGVERIGP